MGFLEKAKEAKGAAAARVAELKDQAVAKAAEIKDNASAKTAELVDQASQAASDLKGSAAAKVNEVMEAGAAKIKEVLAEFNATLPILKTAGYTVGKVKIELGVSPKIIAGFNAIGEPITDQKLEELTAAHSEKKLAILLLKSLFHARKLQESIHIGNLKPQGLAVQIGLLPTVSIDFA